MTPAASSALDQLLAKVSQLVDRIESVLPQPLSAPDWTQAIAWRYRKRSSGHGVLEPVRHVAAMTLAEVLERAGETQQALALLQPVHDWFTEGFATSDLRDAARILARLSGGHTPHGVVPPSLHDAQQVTAFRTAS